MKQKKRIRNILVLLGCNIFFIMCKKDIQNRKNNIGADFIVHHIDTLESNKKNKIKYEYTNKEHDNYSKRYLDIYYIIQDSQFNGELMDLEKYQFGLLENAENIDTIDIDVFNEKGNKYVTFFVYDEIQIPIFKDSINLKYVVTKFGAKTFIK